MDRSIARPFLPARGRITAFGQVQEIRSDITSKYHALVLQFNRRMTNSLQIQSSYTLSSASDNGQTSQTFTPSFSVPFNSFDQRVNGRCHLSTAVTSSSYSMVWTSSYKNKDKRSRMPCSTVGPSRQSSIGSRVRVTPVT